MHDGGVAEDSLRPLLERFVRDGDDAAMEALVRATRRKLVGVAARIGARQDAEDTVQAAYHALLRRGDEPPDAPFPWLVTTVVRIAYRRKAAARRDAALAEKLGRPAPDGGPPTEAARAEERHLVRREVARLPARFRDAVVLHHLEGLSVAETARLLDVPAATVKTRLFRGRALLRGRLAPLLAYGLLAAPWAFSDAARAAVHSLPTTLGGTMTAKTTTIVAGIALATGALGVGMGAMWRGEAAPAHRVAREGGAGDRALAAELAAERERTWTLERRVEELSRAPRPAVSEASKVPARAKQNRTAQPVEAGEPKIPPRATEIAESSRLDPEALRAAARARDGCRGLWRGGRNVEEARQEYALTLAELRAHGEGGYLGVLALMRAGEQGVWFDRLLLDAYQPGFERHLFEALDDGSLLKYGKWSALVGLGAADTPDVHRYLNALLADTKDSGYFYSAARALGRLGDDSSARVIEGRLGAQGYEGVEGHLIGVLGEMGGTDAQAVLVRYLENPRSKLKFLSNAVCALAKADPALAAQHARRLLADPRAGNMSKNNRQWLERVAGRE